jgi:hypothetical protein
MGCLPVSKVDKRNIKPLLNNSTMNESPAGENLGKDSVQEAISNTSPYYGTHQNAFDEIVNFHLVN